jgi:hypothetical protein
MSALTDAVVPGQHLIEIDPAERAETALRDHRIGRFRCDEVRVAGERQTAGADGAEDDLVLLERRRLEHDACAVGQRPLGDPERVAVAVPGDGSRLRLGGKQRLVGQRVDCTPSAALRWQN